VTCTVFWGIGIHYYVHIEEDDNAIWNTKLELWHICWDDPQKGKQFDRKFGNIVEAREWLRKIAKKHFPKKTHRLTMDWHNLHEQEDKRVWLGSYKEGD
jgi:hypothetical protein